MGDYSCLMHIQIQIIQKAKRNISLEEEFCKSQIVKRKVTKHLKYCFYLLMAFDNKNHMKNAKKENGTEETSHWKTASKICLNKPVII